MGTTSSAAMPKTSAACIATAVRVPPMSTEPVTKAMVPLLFTMMVAADICPACQR